jgi:ABC-type multidrug transport system fused ATPase/permease subunit
MKRFPRLVLFSVFFFASLSCFAEVIVPPGDSSPLTDSQALDLALRLIGGLPGAGTMAVVLIVVQLLYVVLRSQFGEKTGVWKLTVLSALALVLGFLSLMAQGIPVTSAILHASMLPLIQNFFAQVVIQYRRRTEDKVLSVTAPKP